MQPRVLRGSKRVLSRLARGSCSALRTAIVCTALLGLVALGLALLRQSDQHGCEGGAIGRGARACTALQWMFTYLGPMRCDACCDASQVQAILVYDVTSKKSFECLDAWVREAQKFGAGHILIVVCGNKVLRPAPATSTCPALRFALAVFRTATAADRCLFSYGPEEARSRRERRLHVHCLLYAACCMLHVHCMLYTACCTLHVCYAACCMLHVHCMLYAACCMLHVVCCMFRRTRRSV
jgi:hypothetical protein